MNGTEKLQSDLKILERFNEDVAAYLRSDILFYPTSIGYPKLTAGGLLMRQHRLLLLRDLLTQAERNRLDRTIADFQAALEGNIVRFESRAQKELGTRLRQWQEHVRDLLYERDGQVNYTTIVEPRLMIAAIVQQLSLPPFQLTSDVPTRVLAIDKALHARWINGDFVLQAKLAAAYPQQDFWYLYGTIVA